MLGTPIEHNEVYARAQELFKLQIKVQLKGTGLIFEKLLRVKDLLTNEQGYSVVINKKVITFKNDVEFYIRFLNIIDATNKETDKEIQFYEGHKNTDFNPDFATLDAHLDELYHKQYKLGKLEEKVKSLLSKIQNPPSEL